MIINIWSKTGAYSQPTHSSMHMHTHTLTYAHALTEKNTTYIYTHTQTHTHARTLCTRRYAATFSLVCMERDIVQFVSFPQGTSAGGVVQIEVSGRER